MTAKHSCIFDLGRILYEARIKEAWGSSSDDRLRLCPYPLHIAAARSAEHDLAISQAKALIEHIPLITRLWSRAGQ